MKGIKDFTRLGTPMGEVLSLYGLYRFIFWSEVGHFFSLGRTPADIYCIEYFILFTESYFCQPCSRSQMFTQIEVISCRLIIRAVY